MSLYVDVHDSMQNERLHIRATNLAPNGIYKLVLRLKHKFGTHMSYAVFKADSAGEIDLPTATPLRGSYSEADPMGLFMSVEPCEDFPFGILFKMHSTATVCLQFDQIFSNPIRLTTAAKHLKKAA
ncbi:Acyl-CoA thioester hydrolase / Bile acid-CoA amino acid N-acetyltransferase, partial [Ostertagia ostertagi]